MNRIKRHFMTQVSRITKNMFPYRGLIVLIALCAFGAIQASYEADYGFEGFKHHGHHNSSNSTGPSGNHSHPHHPGHNSSHPAGGNHSHPHHPGHPGHNNGSHPVGGNHSHPHHPSGNQSHPHHPGHSNSSQWRVPKDGFRPPKGFKPRPIRDLPADREDRPVPLPAVDMPHINDAEPRGFFNRLFNFSRPVYHQPQVNRNSSWYNPHRPSNNSWSPWG
ncbi:histidine-rich glycoprotein-like [Episyrphus balteatus]|uniref:histidine-rich glycoprotein-like n=1 Tax=Episyrphus balteatus TaxID=286459 RepID=UPI0024850908|nr:histidine-rich glycoprotein-like [Episyrphus balteatus]